MNRSELAGFECGAAAVLLPGGPAAVPFEVCCVFAVLRASGSSSAPSVRCGTTEPEPLVGAIPAEPAS